MPRWITWSNLLSITLFLWIFFIPSNLFLKFGENQAYVHGLLVDYLLPKLYLSDLVALGLLFLSWRLRLKKGLPKLTGPILGLMAVLCMLAIRQLWTPHPAAAIWMYVRLVGMGLLIAGLTPQLLKAKHQIIYWGLAITIGFQTVLAAYQFWFQRSFASYYFLGEPNLQRGFGITHGVFSGAEKILPYGTTAHPNILAGVVVVYTWILWVIFLSSKTRPKWQQLITGTATVLSLIVCWMTQSWAAGAMFITGGIVLGLSASGVLTQFLRIFAFGVVVAVLVLIPVGLQSISNIGQQPPSIERRAYLNQAAISMIAHQPWVGVGLNQSTTLVEEFSPNPEVVRFVQPIHHVGLLWMAEAGLIGIAAAVLILRYWSHRQRLISASLVVLPVLVSDHYLITLATGQLLLILLIWSCSFLNINHRLS